MLGARIKWSWICSNQVEDQQGNWGQEAESRKEDRKRRQGTAEMSRNVFEDLDTFVCMLELTFIPSWTFLYCWANSCERKCCVLLVAGQPTQQRVNFGVTVESITESWRALYHRFELIASTAGVSGICGLVILVVILKFIKAQGRMLKIKLKDL